jgi:hypothetical protein
LWTAETWQKNYSAKLAGIHKAAKKMICLSPEYGTLLGKIEVLWYLWYFFPIKTSFFIPIRLKLLSFKLYIIIWINKGSMEFLIFLSFIY